MRPPSYFDAPPDAPGWQARILSPLAALYARATARRVSCEAAWRATVPVLCVGNLNAGGAGKTPTVIALAQRLVDQGVSVHVVSRGYGGRLAGPLRVDERRHGADDCGDEPLLIAAFAPVWVARDRAAGLRAAEAAGAEFILLDDGHQNGAVHKDATLVVVDAARGFGNGRVLPAGPLREPVAAGLARADALLSIGPGPAQDRFDALWGRQVTLPHLRGRLAPLQTGMDWQGARVFAFAGIAHPDKFYATLADMGAEIVGTRSLEDHQPLSAGLMGRIAREAGALSAQLVTTEKDAVRLPPAWRPRVLTVPVRLEIEDWSVLDALLARLRARG